MSNRYPLDSKKIEELLELPPKQFVGSVRHALLDEVLQMEGRIKLINEDETIRSLAPQFSPEPTLGETFTRMLSNIENLKYLLIELMTKYDYPKISLDGQEKVSENL